MFPRPTTRTLHKRLFRMMFWWLLFFGRGEGPYDQLLIVHNFDLRDNVSFGAVARSATATDIEALTGRCSC